MVRFKKKELVIASAKRFIIFGPEADQAMAVKD